MTKIDKVLDGTMQYTNYRQEFYAQVMATGQEVRIDAAQPLRL